MVDSVPFRLMYFRSRVRYFRRFLSLRISCNTPETQAPNVTFLLATAEIFQHPVAQKDNMALRYSTVTV